MSHRGRGNGFVLEGVTAMWMIPLTVVLKMKRTRAGWEIELRVRLFI